MVALVAAILMAMPTGEDFRFSPTDKVVKTDSGLEYADVKEGKGEGAGDGHLALVHYVLRLDDGQEIDSSRKPDRMPFHFEIGKREVIQGWDQGLLGMKPGGTRKLRVPSSLGYGDNGIDGAIPGKATLWFTVELLAITTPAAFTVAERASKNASGLECYDVSVGKGRAAEKGQTVVVHYTLYNEQNQKLETSLRRGGQPLVFEVGSASMIKGFDEGVLGMKPGGMRKLRVPPDMAYGAAGSGPIKPNEVLWFIVDLVEVKKK